MQSAAPCESSASPRLYNSPHWTLFAQDALLVLSGGSDEVYVVDEAVGDTTINRLMSAYREGRLGDLIHDPDCGAAVRQLRRMGALVPDNAVLRGTNYSVRWLGTPQAALLDALRAAPDTDSLAPRYVETDAQADLVLMLRTTFTWQDVLLSYSATPPTRLHLFVDVSHHRTLSIGPFVVPGETACVACLGNRVAHRWGDPGLPPLPRATTRHALLAALILQAVAGATDLQDAPGGDTLPATGTMLLPFLEHALSLNLNSLSSHRDRVFKLPGCPGCQAMASVVPSPGKLVLPWQANTR